MAIDDGRKLFVAGLPDSITEAVLRQLFEATGGTVVDISVPRDRATGRPRGFAFVTLSTEEQATAARDALDNSMQAGRSISVRPFQSASPKRGEGRDRPDFGGDRRERFDRGGDRGERPDRGASRGGTDDRTLYLGNLPYDAAPAQVEKLLEDAGVGPVVRVTLPQDPEGRPRGFGFVTLGSAESAQSAVDALATAELGGRRISASIARGRSERGPRPPGGDMRPPGGGMRPPGGGMRPPGGGMRPPFQERPPDSMGFGPAQGPPPDENRRGDGRRRKDKKKKTKAAGERDDSRRGPAERGARRGRWDDDSDDY